MTGRKNTYLPCLTIEELSRPGVRVRFRDDARRTDSVEALKGHEFTPILDNFDFDGTQVVIDTTEVYAEQHLPGWLDKRLEPGQRGWWVFIQELELAPPREIVINGECYHG